MTPLNLKRVLFALVLALQFVVIFSQPTRADGPDTQVIKIPVDYSIFSPCTGETVYFRGYNQYVIHTSTDATGGYHFKLYRTAHVQGVTTDGTRYVGRDPLNVSQEVSVNGATTFTVTHTSHLIRQGEAVAGDDLMLHSVTHFTVNAQGKVTANTDTLTLECR